MNIHDACEQAYKNGYEAGKKDAVKWIPVTERLPDKSGDYLVWTVWDNCTNLEYSVVHKAFNASDSIPNDAEILCTHWMPLPEPPKEVE